MLSVSSLVSMSQFLGFFDPTQGFSLPSLMMPAGWRQRNFGWLKQNHQKAASQVRSESSCQARAEGVPFFQRLMEAPHSSTGLAKTSTLTSLFSYPVSHTFATPTPNVRAGRRNPAILTISCCVTTPKLSRGCWAM